MPKKREINIEHTLRPVNDDRSNRRITEVAAQQDIRARAIEAGRRNEPRTQETRPDEHEQQLHARSHDAIGAMTRIAAAELNEATNEALAIMPDEMNIDLEVSMTQREVMEARSEHEVGLGLAQDKRGRATRDLNGFEAEHHLPPRSALYGNDHTMFFTKLMFLVLLEAILNAFFLQEMQNRGLLGGLLLAFTVGFANVLIGLGTGFLGWRLMIHKRIGNRLTGLLITLVLMTSALALHLALSDLREAITHDADAKIDFLTILRPWDWFHFTSIAPFALFALGMAAFTISALKGRGGASGINSAYIGHDTLDRRLKEAEDDVLDMVDNFKDALANGYDGERANLLARHAQYGKQLARIRALAARARGVKQTLGDSVAAEIGRLQTWIRMYRDVNQEVRTTPPPSYFNDYPTFDDWLTPRLDLTELQTLVSQAEALMVTNAATLAAFQDRTLKDQMRDIAALDDIVGASEAKSNTRVARDGNAAPRARKTPGKKR